MRVLYKKRFEKKIRRLPVKVKEQFYDRLELFLTDKFHRVLNNHSVDHAFPACRSINITGDYRAIFQELNSTVVFITIGTHAELYA